MTKNLNMNEQKSETQKNENELRPPTPKSGRNNKLVWGGLSVLIATASIWAVASQSKDLSLRILFHDLSKASPLWLCAAVCCMLGFILFEAYALHSVCRAFGARSTFKRGCIYSAADIYFSAITPSATGGQPASAFLMMRDGISGPVTAAALLLNLSMYALSILTVGLISFILQPNIFLHFSTACQVLIVMGCAVQLGLALFFLLLVRTERLLQKICCGTLRLLGKLHLLRGETQKQKKLRTAMQDYKKCAAMLAGQKRLLWRVFLLNLLQRISQISVTMFVYLAMGNKATHAVGVWAMQSYVVLGSNYVPVPGAMGVADYMMLNGLNVFLPEHLAVRLELLSRSLSFYICILICGIAVLLHYWIYKKRGLNR